MSLISVLSCFLTNRNDPFGQYIPDHETGYSTELLCGSWYESAYKSLITVPDRQFMLPIEFHGDGTTGDKVHGRINLEPFSFTLGILRNNLRNKAANWRALGYVTSMKTQSTALAAERRGNCSAVNTVFEYTCVR